MKDLDEDRAAILAVIEAETDAYLRRDYDTWESHWLDGPEVRRIHAHAGTGVYVMEGTEVRAKMRRILEDNPEPLPSDLIRRENLNLVVSPTMAWASYDQVGDSSGVANEMAGVQHELKILQKVDGAWKIACIVVTQRRVDHVTAPLVEVDENARILWMNDAARKRLPDHPRLGQRGTMLKARHPAAQIEIIDALAWLAKNRNRHTPCDGQEAVTRVVALGQDDAGLAHICWAVLQDGKLLITFDDTVRLDRQLAAAGVVYDLSDTQARLGRLLVEGCDLAAAATVLGVSPNTARTHLQRIYDKTGVRAQPALVRLLLSADRRGV